LFDGNSKHVKETIGVKNQLAIKEASHLVSVDVSQCNRYIKVKQDGTRAMIGKLIVVSPGKRF
jgi:hypothetical protein